MTYRYLFLLLISLTVTRSLKTVTFSAELKKILNIDVAEYNQFESWFRQTSTPLDIIKLNPGINSISEVNIDTKENTNEILNDANVINKSYIAQLAPMRFPGLTVTSTLLFQCSFDPNNNIFSVSCDDSGNETKYEGSSFLKNVVSKLIPRVKSLTKYKLADDKTLTNIADLKITFDLPDWFPLSTESIEKSGSESISKNLDKDLSKLLNSIYQLYKEARK